MHGGYLIFHLNKKTNKVFSLKNIKYLKKCLRQRPRMIVFCFSSFRLAEPLLVWIDIKIHEICIVFTNFHIKCN